MSSGLFAVVDRLPADTFVRLVAPCAGITPFDAGLLARRALREFLGSAAGRKCGSWAEAWNLLTGASEGASGVLRVSVHRCGTCDGRGWVSGGSVLVRAMSRGLPAGCCPDCAGSGRLFREYRFVARFVPVP